MTTDDLRITRLDLEREKSTARSYHEYSLEHQKQIKKLQHDIVGDVLYHFCISSPLTSAL